jgi:hypothetical protein
VPKNVYKDGVIFAFSENNVMSDNEIENDVLKKKRVPLKTIDDILRYTARKIREFENDQDAAKHLGEYRTAGFLIGKMIDGFKVKKDFEIEKEILEIKSMLAGMGK